MYIYIFPLDFQQNIVVLCSQCSEPAAGTASNWQSVSLGTHLVNSHICLHLSMGQCGAGVRGKHLHFFQITATFPTFISTLLYLLRVSVLQTCRLDVHMTDQ